MIAICCFFEDRYWVQRRSQNSDPKSCSDRSAKNLWMSSQPCHPSFPRRQPASGALHKLSCSEQRDPPLWYPQGQHKTFRCPKAASLCSVAAPLQVRKAESMMLTWGSCRCCGTLQVDSLVLFESQSTVVWLAEAGTPVNHWVNIDLPWLKRKKLNIRPENAVGNDVLAHKLLVIFTGPWRSRKYYTVPWKPNIKLNFCFCSWCSLYSFHPASSWEYFNARKNLLYSLKNLSLAISMRLQGSDSQGITSWTQHRSDSCHTHAKVILVWL